MFVEKLMGSKSKARLLSVLISNPNLRFHLSGLCTRAAVPTGNGLKALSSLIDMELVLVTEGLRGKEYSLNSQHRAMPHLSKLFTLDSDLIQSLRQAVSKMPVAAALVFGSYANGTQSENSDIDILLVSDELSKVSAGALFKPLAKEVGKEINVTLVGSKEYAEFRLKTEGFWFNLFKNPILLKGELPA